MNNFNNFTKIVIEYIQENPQYDLKSYVTPEVVLQDEDLSWEYKMLTLEDDVRDWFESSYYQPLQRNLAQTLLAEATSQVEWRDVIHWLLESWGLSEN